MPRRAVKAGIKLEIKILELLEGARRARGLTVVIDVFRAFSLEACLFARGAKTIYAVGAEATARRLKAENPGALLVGERGGKILPGFDYGNSPSQTESAPARGATFIHTTSAGTQGLAAAAPGASEILTGSLLNASAIARYIKSRNPERLSLVAMGWEGKTSSPEDVLCARLVKARLENSPIDMNEGLAAVRAHPEGQKFFDPARQEIFPEKDFHICTRVDAFDFVIVAHPVESDVFKMERVEVPKAL